MSESECRQFEKKLAHFTAPTLLGIKCASLVSLSREEFDIPSYAAAFNARAEKGGLQMQIMCRCQKRLLVLLYRNCCKSGWKSRQSGSSCIDMGTQMTWIWQPVLCGCKSALQKSRSFPTRSGYSWGIRWRMWMVLSHTRARTANCAAVGRCTATWNRHAGHLPTMKNAEYFSAQS